MTRHKNRTTLLHYAAAYAESGDISWLLKMFGDSYLNWADSSGRNALHWAAWKGNTDVVEVLVKSDIHLVAEDSNKQRPLTLALVHGHFSVAEKLLELRRHKLQVLLVDDFRMWISKLKDKMRNDPAETLFRMFHDPYYPTPCVVANDLDDFIGEMSPFYVALHSKEYNIINFIEKHTREDHVVNEKSRLGGWTALHYATLLNDLDVVKILCRHGSQTYGEHLFPMMEDNYKHNAIQYAVKLEHRQIMRELMERNDVRLYVEGLYRDRQLYVDAANAILVGAALIADVTFAGWLQPPLGGSKQEYPKHIGIRLFWSLNSLSFLFSMSTVLAGAGAVLPTGDIFIAEAVIYIRRGLLLAATLLSFSVIFVVGAFIAAGFVVLPSSFKYEANMMATTIAGGIIFLMCLRWFLVSLYRLRPSWMKNIFRENTNKNFLKEKPWLRHDYW